MQKEAVLVSPVDVVSWESVLQDVKMLSQQIKCTPDIIVGVARGGVLPAVFLSKHLGVEETFFLKVKKEGEQRVLLQEVACSVRGKKILVVDDMIETGKGLELVKEHLESRGASVMTASLYVLSTTTTTVRPDWYVKEVEEVKVFVWDQ